MRRDAGVTYPVVKRLMDWCCTAEIPRLFVVVVVIEAVIDGVPILDYDNDNDHRRSRYICTVALVPPARHFRSGSPGVFAESSPLLRTALCGHKKIRMTSCFSFLDKALQLRMESKKIPYTSQYLNGDPTASGCKPK